MAEIVWLNEPSSAGQRLGGKGAGLAHLHQAGFPVPPGFVVTAESYERFVAENALAQSIADLLSTPDLRLPKMAREACTPLQKALSTARLPETVARAIADGFAMLRSNGVHVVAARSSALSEDGSGASSAGLYDTFLNLRDEAALLDGVLRCYHSLWTPRAVQYRAIKGLSGGAEAMAVVVMALVPADVAGVAFTVNPVTGDRDQILVNASWGLGEAVVSGQVTPDSFVLSKHPLAVTSREVYEKELEIVPDQAGGSGTVQRAVSGERRLAPALDDAALVQLGELCLRIEAHHGRPMDIEWAFARGQLYVLQARPVTGLA
jgi:pyruvate,water dikinase